MTTTAEQDVTVEAIAASHLRGTKIEDIARIIEGKDELLDEDLEFIWELVSQVSPLEITVSASETRQVRQYEPNNYHASIKISFGDAAERILERVKAAPPDKRPESFVNCKRILYGLIAEQYARNEDYLRSLMQAQQQGDGLTTR